MTRFYLYLLAVLLAGSSCTAPRWVIIDEEAVDTGEAEVRSSRTFLSREGPVSPEDPVLRWQLYSRTTSVYPVRFLAERHLQEYRLRPGSLLLGSAGAGLAFWLARNSDGSRLERIGLYTAGGMVALYGLLNMKPVGTPQPTGEERYLRQTGTVQRTDTLEVRATGAEQAAVELFYAGRRILSDSTALSPGGLLEINLGARLGGLEIRGPDPGEVRIEVSHGDSLYRTVLPAVQVLQPYADITAPVTELRSRPDSDEEHVLAELGEGSRLNVLDPEGEGNWYPVRYGISESYILKSSAELIWDTAESEQANQVVTVTQVPFGQVDVENNIPILSPLQRSAAALVVTNEQYGEPFGNRTYTHRDGRLINSYLVKSLGYPRARVDTLRDAREGRQMLDRIRRLRDRSSDSSRVFIYLGGRVRVENDTSGIALNYLLSSAPGDTAATEMLSLDQLFEQIAAVPGSKVVVADLDFHPAGGAGLPDERTIDLRRPLRRLSAQVAAAGSRSAVFFSSELNQGSRLYLAPSVDKKHHIFTYFFVRALQDRHTRISAIRQYLDSNVSYTSRRYHDRPQEPRLFGDTGIGLADD